ncbi:uncharacterized protein [Leuresthes tenuis]|uniref:uncharacterized protein isoform X2 n=1 Tax=Leuresthes tenuis TaxID=355514 RepID=UPI003B51208B
MESSSAAASSVPADPNPQLLASSVPADPNPQLLASSVPADPNPQLLASSVPADPNPQLLASSVPADPNPQLLASSSPRLSLQSPELQAEFLKECRSRFQFHSDSSVAAPPSSPLPSPFSPTSSSSSSSCSPASSSSPSPNTERAHLSLSSPELLSELKESRRRSLRHVPAKNGLTTIFSGRGAQVSDSAPSTKPANQRISR